MRTRTTDRVQAALTHKTKNVLITGGAGLIGSHLVDKFVNTDYLVSIIDDLSGGYRRNINPKSKFYKCDLRNVKETEKIVNEIKPTLVYHLAANAAENKAQFSPIDITSRNYNTFINVLVPALINGMKRIVVVSSISVYGALQTPFKETDKPEPKDLYGISKLAMEESLKVLAKIHKFEYVITRLHNVYGPRQNMQDPYRNVVTIFMNALLKGEPYYIFGDGNQQRCFSYIDDVIEALYKCGSLDVNGMTFNIGSDKSYTLNGLSDAIRDVTGINTTPKYFPSRPLDVTNAISDHTMSKKYLNYDDKTSLKDGIKLTWEYAKELGYQKPVYGGIEIDSPLIPKSWRNK